MIPKIRDTVQAPSEWGNKPYVGVVAQVGEVVDRNRLGVRFLWTSVQHPSGSKHIWPSHRIGYTLTEADLLALAKRAMAAEANAAASPE